MQVQLWQSAVPDAQTSKRLNHSCPFRAGDIRRDDGAYPYSSSDMAAATKIGEPFLVRVLIIRALQLGVYIRPPDFVETIKNKS